MHSKTYYYICTDMCVPSNGRTGQNMVASVVRLWKQKTAGRCHAHVVVSGNSTLIELSASLSGNLGNVPKYVLQ